MSEQCEEQGMAKETEQQINDAFEGIVDATVAQEANQLLEKQLGHVREWIQQHVDNDDPATLHKLIQQVMHEPSKREHVLIAYCAALWKLKDATP